MQTSAYMFAYMKELQKCEGKAGLPKYKVITEAIMAAIAKGQLKPGDRLPSSPRLSKDFMVARDTVIKAINDLKSKGIITSQPGKGYYVLNSEIKRQRNVFLLFDSFNAGKETIYNSFLQHVGKNMNIDIYFHHFNPRIFEFLIQENLGKYTDYIIMPIMWENSEKLLKKLQNYGKLIILDQGLTRFGKKFNAVCQDYTGGIFQSLERLRERVREYKQFIIVLPPANNPSSELITREIEMGFMKFCRTEGIAAKSISSLEKKKLEQGNCYFLHTDGDLEQAIIAASEQNFVLGKDIGILSFNETALKKVVANGITTISVDYSNYGKMLARMVRENTVQHLINPTDVYMRNSI